MATQEIGYGEGVSLASVQPYSDNSCTSRCEVLADQRRCNGVNFGSALHPVTYTDSMFCFSPETEVPPPLERRYRTSVNCELTQRPRSFFETCYILPKRLATTFVSRLEYGAVKVTRRWYSSSVRFQSRSSCSAWPLGLTGSDISYNETEVDLRKGSSSDVFLPATPSIEGEGRHCTVVEATVESCSLPSIAPDEDGVLRLELTSDVNNNDGDRGRDVTSYRVQQFHPAGGGKTGKTSGMETSGSGAGLGRTFRTTMSVDNNHINNND